MNYFKSNTSEWIKDKKILDAINKYRSISPDSKINIGVLKDDNSFISEDELFYIGSVSKVFTSLLVLKTIKKYTIDIHQNINDFLNLKEGNYPTIYECLTHTSGLTFYLTLKITFKNLLFDGYYKKNPYEKADSAKVIKYLESTRFKKRRSKTYHYSDFNYAILSLVLEKIENRKIKDLLQEFIVKDLKLLNTYICYHENVSESVLRGKCIKAWVWNDNNPFISAGGFISNTYDLMKFAEMIIYSDADYIKKADEICLESKNKKNIMTTCSFHTYQKSNQLWHVGSVGTHRSMIIINKQKKCAAVALCNSKGIKKGNVSYICKMLYEDLKRNKIRSVNN